MNDAEFLDEVVNDYKRLDGLMPAFNFEIRDLTYTKTLFQSKALQIIRDPENNFIDKDGFPPDIGGYSKQWTIADAQDVIKNRIPKRTITINYLAGKIQPYLSSKFPVVNPENNTTVAVLVVIQQLLYNSVPHLLLRALEIYKEPESLNFEQYKLSKREKQLIFLYLGGLNSKEIAIVLSKLDGKEISKNTIDNIFTNQLRVKFNAYSRESLFDKLLELGFDQMIPQDLLIGIKLPLQILETY